MAAFRKQKVSSYRWTWDLEPYIARNVRNKKGYAAINVPVTPYGTNALCIELTPRHTHISRKTTGKRETGKQTGREVKLNSSTRAAPTIAEASLGIKRKKGKGKETRKKVSK